MTSIDDNISWVVPSSTDELIIDEIRSSGGYKQQTFDDHDCVKVRGSVVKGFAIAITCATADEGDPDVLITSNITLCDFHGCCIKVILPNLCRICRHYLLNNAPDTAFIFTNVKCSFKPVKNKYHVMTTNTTALATENEAVVQFKHTTLESMPIKTESTCHYPLVSFTLPTLKRISSHKSKCVLLEIPLLSREPITMVVLHLYSIEYDIIDRLAGQKVVLSDVRVVYGALGTPLSLYSSPNSLLVGFDAPRFMPMSYDRALAIDDVKNLIQFQRRVKLQDGTRGYIVYQMGAYVVVTVVKDVPLVVSHISSVFYDSD